MDSRSFRFLHAADSRQITPCCGVSPLSAPLHRSCIAARYAAASRVLNTAMVRGVDFVVLDEGIHRQRKEFVPQ